MNFLLVVIIVLAVIVIAVLAAAAIKPKAFHIERSITTTASASDVYAVISDLKRFPEWSPWHNLDPDMQYEISEPSHGVDAYQAWSGNNQVGEGRMAITEATENNHVRLQLEFIRPWQATNMVEWRIDDDNGQRRITWSMDGANETIVMRLFAMFMNMDKMVGKDFEKGLQNLKEIVERS